MAYVDPNYKSKAALKRGLAAGDYVTVYAPGIGSVPDNGMVTVEGPHFPKPHTWYGQVEVKDGKVVKVIK